MLYHLLVALAGSAVMLALISAALWTRAAENTGGGASRGKSGEESMGCEACGLGRACHFTGETV